MPGVADEDRPNLAEAGQGVQLRPFLGIRLSRRTRPRPRQPSCIPPFAIAKRAPFRPPNDSTWDIAGKAGESEAPQRRGAPPEEATVPSLPTKRRAPLSVGGLARTAARRPSSPSQPPTAAPPFRHGSNSLPAAPHRRAGPLPHKVPTPQLLATPQVWRHVSRPRHRKRVMGVLLLAEADPKARIHGKRGGITGLSAVAVLIQTT
jgi:hypothetical protein